MSTVDSPVSEKATGCTVAIGGQPSAWAQRWSWIDGQRPSGVNDDAWYRTLKFLCHNLDDRLPVRLKFDPLPNGEVSTRIAYKVWAYTTDTESVITDGDIN